jgi:hypothetical protein
MLSGTRTQADNRSARMFDLDVIPAGRLCCANGPQQIGLCRSYTPALALGCGRRRHAVHVKGTKPTAFMTNESMPEFNISALDTMKEKCQTEQGRAYFAARHAQRLASARRALYGRKDARRLTAQERPWKSAAFRVESSGI